jgi:hypothetical protein
MANTVSTISYANTFGQWMVATNALIAENNILAAGDYTKDSGTLYLSETTKNALQANGSVVVQKELRVQGVASSATVDNNLTVGGQIYFSNTTLGLTNSGQANINGLLVAQGSGIGLSVANNAYIGGNTTIRYTTTTGNIQANGLINTASVSVTGNVIAANLNANTSGSIPNLTIGTKLDGNNAAGFLNSLQIQGGGLTVNGNFTLTGTTVYASNTFQLSTGTSSGISSYLQVDRGSSGVDAAIRWNEIDSYWDMLNVTSNTYYRILTNEYFNDTITSTSTTSVATANVANTLSNQLTAANTFLQAAVTSAGSYGNSAFLKANSAYALANTFANTFVGTSGSISQSAGVISFSSNNGLTIVATSANNLAVSTSQDLRTSASPTFAGLTLTTPLALSQGGTGTTSAASALTALLPTGTTAGYVLTTGGPGNFYWAAGSGGGGGATPGTSINSTRLSYTANGASGYTGNSFVIPAATADTQVRAYINGVRQFESEYALNLSANTIAFTTTPPNGDAVLIEVDGYYVNPYYANNIAFTINSSISSTANTIQLAIDGLTSKVTTYYANLVGGSTFTGDIRGVTMATGTSNTSFATTAFVQAAANNISTAVYTSGSYANPSWITSLARSKIIGMDQDVGTANNVQHASIGIGTAASGTAGEIRATGEITAYYSDDNLKTRLGTIDNALDKLCSLTGFYYQANETAQALGYKVKREVGVSAQEVQKVMPEVVSSAPIDDKYLTIHYERLIPLLIESIKELKNEVDVLKGQIK